MKHIILFLFSGFLFSCSSTRQSKIVNNQAAYTIGGKITSSLFQQRAAEYRALCLQGYNIALMRINEYVPATTLPRAIITDIDETILDNSPYAVKQGFIGNEYDAASWHQWTSLGSADTMPGAASFLKTIAAKGIEVFYLSNRGLDEQEGTLKNLQRFGLPNADAQHLFLKKSTSSKEERRQLVLSTHEVVLLMGDNLADFAKVWDKASEEKRKDAVTNLSDLFGKKFIVFPNPNYGDWEGAFYKYNYKYSQAQKDSVLRSELKSY